VNNCIRLLATLSVLVCSLAVFAKTTAPIDITIIGDRDYEPYSYEENGIAKGLYVVILQEVFKKLGNYNVTFKMLPWKRALAMAEAGEQPAIFPPYYRPIKRPYISKYSEPIYVEKVLPICIKGVLKNNNPQWPSDYKGLSIGTNRGFLAPGKAFFEMAAKGELKLVETQNSYSALRMLMLNRIDCYVNSKLTIDWNLNQLKQLKTHQYAINHLIFGPVISQENAYIGYTKYGNKEPLQLNDFSHRVDVILKEMKRAGLIDEILLQFTTVK
jgi:polar amino acid transport system substrate-binding protein